jgi:hypothetical protein
LGETARDRTFICVNPVLTALQLVPLFVDRKTPSPSVPAKRFIPPAPLGETARDER